MSKADAEEHEALLRQGVREMQARPNPPRPAPQRAPLHPRHSLCRARRLGSMSLQSPRSPRLSRLCRATGWRFGTHHTGDSAQSALLWLYRALDGGTA